VTGDMEFTLRPAARNQAVDLSAIRRTDAIVDLLAARRLLRPHALGDPAITLLRALAADVGAAEARQATRRPGTAPRRPLRPAGQTRRGSGWAPSAAAAAVITSAAAAVVAVAAAGLVVMSALTRLGGMSRHQMYRRMPRRITRPGL
jgi:hypothetical protein